MDYVSLCFTKICWNVRLPINISDEWGSYICSQSRLNGLWVTQSIQLFSNLQGHHNCTESSLHFTLCKSSEFTITEWRKFLVTLRRERKDFQGQLEGTGAFISSWGTCKTGKLCQYLGGNFINEGIIFLWKASYKYYLLAQPVHFSP